MAFVKNDTPPLLWFAMTTSLVGGGTHDSRLC